MPVSELGHDELVRLYGPWTPNTPRDAARLLDGYSGRWWVAGGCAIEAFTGVHRPHGDLDLSIPRHELPALRRYVAGRLDVWAASSGTLQPLLTQDIDADAIPDDCGNVWLRADGAAPWQYDVLLMDHREETWTFKRDGRITARLDDLCWQRDDVSYLRPEIQLLHKARGRRPQDQHDLDVAWPLLDDPARAWLTDALALAHPGHPWGSPA